MQAYLPKSFQREAKRDEITDQNCKDAIQRAEKGLIDANLGGRLVKQRIPRGSQGAARGLRAVIFYKRGEVAVFLHLFAKSGKANLTKSELAEYLTFAQFLEKLSEAKLRELGKAKGGKS